MLTDVKHCLKTCEQPLIRHSQSSFIFLHHQRQRNANRCQALTENMWKTVNPTYPILFQIFLSLSTNVKHCLKTCEQRLIRDSQSSFNFLHHQNNVMLTDVKHCLKTCEQPLIRHSQSSFNFLHHQSQRNANRCQALPENMWTTVNPTYPILFQIFLSLSTNVKHCLKTCEQPLIRHSQSSFNFLHHRT